MDSIILLLVIISSFVLVMSIIRGVIEMIKFHRSKMKILGEVVKVLDEQGDTQTMYISLHVPTQEVKNGEWYMVKITATDTNEYAKK